MKVKVWQPYQLYCRSFAYCEGDEGLSLWYWKELLFPSFFLFLLLSPKLYLYALTTQNCTFSLSGNQSIDLKFQRYYALQIFTIGYNENTTFLRFLGLGYYLREWKGFWVLLSPWEQFCGIEVPFLWDCMMWKTILQKSNL